MESICAEFWRRGPGIKLPLCFTMFTPGRAKKQSLSRVRESSGDVAGTPASVSSRISHSPWPSPAASGTRYLLPSPFSKPCWDWYDLGLFFFKKHGYLLRILVTSGSPDE